MPYTATLLFPLPPPLSASAFSARRIRPRRYRAREFHMKIENVLEATSSAFRREAICRRGAAPPNYRESGPIKREEFLTPTCRRRRRVVSSSSISSFFFSPPPFASPTLFQPMEFWERKRRRYNLAEIRTHASMCVFWKSHFPWPEKFTFSAKPVFRISKRRRCREAGQAYFAVARPGIMRNFVCNAVATASLFLSSITGGAKFRKVSAWR